MGTTNSDFLPNESGLNLGSPDQQWDGFFKDVTVAGIFSSGGVPVATGDATSLQGIPVSPNAPAINQALIYNGSVWLPQNQSGGGGGASFGYVAVSFSATPIFTPSPVGSCTFELTLTGNVTSSTFTTAGLSAGTLMTFILNQDATGSRTFAYPTGFQGATIIGSFANQTTVQQFLYNGTVFKAIGLGVSYP